MLKHLFPLALLAAACAATSAHATTSANLIVNGNGETGKCAKEWDQATTVPGWTTTQGNPVVQCYSVASISTPSSSQQGNAFLADGPYGDSAMNQTVSVASAATAIDGGSVTYSLTGWVGGYSTYDGQATVTSTFLNASGASLGSATLNPETPWDRGYSTKLLAESASGKIPAGTRSITTQIVFNDTDGSQNVGYVDNLSLTLNTAVTAPVLAAPVSKVPAFDHVFVIYLENTDYSETVGNTTYAPYFNSLFAKGALLTNYNGVYHPSDENYLALAGGDTYTEGATYYPDINDPNQHIGDVIESAGKTWKSYEQGMGTPCNMTNSADSHFHADDAPFANYTNISGNLSRCQAHLQDITQMTSDLQSTATTPAFSWVAADNWYNGEDAYYSDMSIDTSMQAQDQFLSKYLPILFSSPAWTQQRSLLIITFDESSTGSWVSGTYNQVATVVLGSQGTVKAGYQSNVHYNHYSSARTLEAAIGVGAVTANDQYAAPMNDVFTGN